MSVVRPNGHPVCSKSVHIVRLSYCFRQAVPEGDNPLVRVFLVISLVLINRLSFNFFVLKGFLCSFSMKESFSRRFLVLILAKIRT